MKRATCLILSLSVVSRPLWAGTYNFSGACESRGDWTRQALEVSDSLGSYLEDLKNDPNCKGLASIIVRIQELTQRAGQDLRATGSSEQGKAYATFPEKITMFRSLLTSPQPVKPNILAGVFDLLTEDRVGDKNLMEQTTRAADQGVSLLQSLLTDLSMGKDARGFDIPPLSLSAHNRCLESNPSIGLSILGATLHLTNAFLTSGEGMFERLGGSISRFVDFLRVNKFEQRLRELDRVDYITSLACIMETTADSYCRANNAYEMLDLAVTDMQTRKNLDDERSYRPLEGYFLLQREVPIVSEWLQGVMYGVEPRTVEDARFKTSIQDNINNLVGARYRILGSYNYQLTLLKGFALKTAQQDEILSMLRGIVANIDSAGQTQSAINFFYKAVKKEDIPFFLIGREFAPRETVVPSANSPQPVEWTRYMKYYGATGSFIEEFDKPLQLADTIYTRLTALLDLALVNASDYFQQQLIIDMENLIARSLTSQTISVVEALGRINNYLKRLAEEIMAGYGEKAILANVLDTHSKITLILEGYDRGRAIIKAYLEATEGKSYEEKVSQILQDKELKELYEDLVTRVYGAFNILYQRDMFLQTRMKTFVQNDYAYKTQHMENLSEQQRLILTVSGRELIERLRGAYRDNPTLMRRDLDNANVVNAANIYSLQRSFDDKIFSLLLELKLVEEGSYNAVSMNAAALNSFIYDAIPKELNLLAPFEMVGRIFHNMVWNRQRYDGPNIFDIEHIGYENNGHEVIKGLRSKLCLQALMFENSEIFSRICRGTVLNADEAALDDVRAQGLDASYDRYLSEKIRAKEQGTKKDYLKARDRNICAYYDFKMKNRAYWLLKSLKSQRNHSESSDGITTEP